MGFTRKMKNMILEKLIDLLFKDLIPVWKGKKMKKSRFVKPESVPICLKMAIMPDFCQSQKSA